MKQLEPRRVLLIVSAAVFMASLDLFIVNIAFPDVQRDLGGSDSSLSWVLNAYAIVFAALLVPAGRIADLVGRKRTFLTGLVVFALASALCAAAPSLGMLVAFRILQAAGAAMLVPTSLALLLSAAPIEKRSAYVGAWAAVGGVAAAAGPPIGGLLVQLSWRWVFIVNLPVAAFALIIGLRMLREERDPDSAGLPDLLGAALLTAGVGALTAGIVQGPQWGWASTGVVALFAASVVLLVGFSWRSSRHPLPVVEMDLLRVRAFAAANVAALAFYVGFGAMLLGGVLFLTRVWGESVLTAGLMIAPGPLMAATFSVVAGRFGDRAGHRTLAVIGGLVFGLGSLYWALRMSATPNYAGAFLPGFIVGGIGVGLVNPTLSSAAAASLPSGRFATGSAIYNMSRQLGSALGVALLVAIVGTPSPAGAVGAFRDGVLIVVGGGALTAIAAASMGRVSVGAAPAVVAPEVLQAAA